MKYGKDITNKICNSIIELKGRVNACKEAGIGYDAFCEWMKKPEFNEAIKKAENECLMKGRAIAIQSIFKAMPNSWQAGAWWLERNFKQEFALRTELTGAEGQPISPITAVQIITDTKQLNGSPSHKRISQTASEP